MAVIKPVANFTATPLTWEAPLSVVFTDSTTNTPTQRFWDFWDGNTSEEQNPTNIFYKEWHYTISLIAYNRKGKSTKTRVVYVNPTETTPWQENVKDIVEGTRGARTFPNMWPQPEPVSTDVEKFIDYAEDGDREDHQDIYE